MNPVNPWLDPTEVRRLAERLIRPVQNPAISVQDAGFSEAFVGYAPQAQPTETIAPPPANSPQKQDPTFTQSAPAVFKKIEKPVAATVRGPFLDRIHRFRDWMRQYFSASEIFILDREGMVIFDESQHGRLHFLARGLAMASRRQGTTAGNVHVKIGAGATLEVIPVDTPYGCLVLGAVVPEALPPAAVSAVMEALSLVATPPDQAAMPQSDSLDS